MAEAKALLAEFDSPEALLSAAKALRKAEHPLIEAFTPFPVEGLADLFGHQTSRIPVIGLWGGLAGLAFGFGIQIFTNLDYPLNIGGRPLVSWQVYTLVAVEMMAIGAVFAVFFGMLILNRLPRLHHPLFDIERFERATMDGFFLLVPVGSEGVAGTSGLLLEQDPRSIVEVTL